MGYHNRIESKELSSLNTIRSRNSELWLINNPKLENTILANLANCRERYGALLYAFAIEGNHLHCLAKFPNANRAHFQRDFNSAVARAVPRYVQSYPGGRLWARRYSSEIVPEKDDIEEYFFYTVLQPVNDGLVDKISDYDGYNCFSDAVNGVVRTFKVIQWGAYNSAKRWNPQVSIDKFTCEVTLKYERLPGYEHLTQKEYSKLMHDKLEARRLKIIEERKGKPSAGGQALREKAPGALPKRTKVSSMNSRRPRVLCVCLERWKKYMQWYFDIYYKFKEASARFRKGELTVPFPDGTYRPPVFTAKAAVVI